MKNRSFCRLSLSLSTALLVVLSVGSAQAAIGWSGNLVTAVGGDTHASGYFGLPAEATYAEVWKDGVTNAAGQGAGITAEWGYGATGSDPTTWSTWAAANYLEDALNNDKYAYEPDGVPVGTYDWVFRFSDDGGTTWDYTYDHGEWGTLEIVPYDDFWAAMDNPDEALTESDVLTDLPDMSIRIWVGSGPDCSLLESPCGGVLAEFGIGPDGTDPSSDLTGWDFYPAAFTADDGSDDRYTWVDDGSVGSALDIGNYDYCWRISLDAGVSWHYVDREDAGSGIDETGGYNADFDGNLKVNCTNNSQCENGDVCDGLATCDLASGDCQAGFPLTCDDGNPCNGLETCDPITACQAGTPTVCDDGIDCTDDSCNPADGSCVYAANDANCADGDVCNGVETCDSALGCQAGTALACSDGNTCTTDACDAVNGCEFTPIVGCTGGTSCVEQDTQIDITDPFDNQRFELGYVEWTPELTGDVTLSFDYTEFDGTDQLVIYVDDAAPITIALAASYELVGLDAGAHTVSVFLADSTGKPYCGARDAVRFYLSRVCLEDTECEDSDPCTFNRCITESGLDGWRGRCRFGDDPEDPDCCVNEHWCAQKGLSFGEAELQYACSDVDMDGTGDCVQCVTNDDCWLTSACHLGALCVDNECVYTDVPGCCLDDFDCDDGNACTVDSCGTTNPNECDFTPIEGCCLPGSEALEPGDPTYGCTPADASPCEHFVCIGQAAEATCKVAQVWRECCADDTDCDTARLLTPCVDPTSLGHAVCDLTQTPDPSNPDAHVCDYTPIEGCCTSSWQCADQYPVQIGTCTDVGGDYNECQYEANPDYCTTSVTTLVISEIMLDSSLLVDPDGEWFEIYNPTASDVNIDGWFIGGDTSHIEEFEIEAEGDTLIVPAGRAITLAASGATNVNGGFVPDYVYNASAFSMGADDAIYLMNATGVVQDVVDWDVGWLAWGPNTSMALISPYLDNALVGSWVRSKLVYGTVADVDSLGTPGEPNRDAFDEALTTGGTCDDGNACTLDLCNYSKANVCSHMPLFDCCLVDETECNDYNVCTEDTCDTGTFHCSHVHANPNCCVTDEDCVGTYPAEFDTAAEQTNFDLCGVAACLGGACRYGRDRTRPGCCVATDAELGFGCGDRNVCTTDECTPDAGGPDGLGVTYPACTYDADLNDDGTDDCCFTSLDCDDSDPATIDVCNRVEDNPECPDSGQSQCCYLENPLYCDHASDCDDGLDCTTDYCCAAAGVPDAACTGPNECVHVDVEDDPVYGPCCEAHAQCSDGDACSTDYCCVAFGDPVPECLAANMCVSVTESPEGCCDSREDCNGENAPPEMLCREGYCIGGACRYAPPTNPECCVDVSLGHCDDGDPCTVDTCGTTTPNVCDHVATADCCVTAEDCPAPADSCMVAACQDGGCVELALPNCCVDEDPNLPDDECADEDPCTTDYCMDVGDKFQCRHFKTGGPGCCATSATCPDDGVQCTDKDCSGEYECTLTAIADCLTVSPYEMDFTEGNAVYAGEYEAVTDFGWSNAETGTGSMNAASWIIADGGLLGADQYLSLQPIAQVTNYASCVVLPKFDTRGGAYWMDLTFSYAADVLTGGTTIEVRVATDGDWANAHVWGTPIALDADIPESVFSADESQPPPSALMNSDQTQLAICVVGADSDAIAEVDIDDIYLEKFTSPPAP